MPKTFFAADHHLQHKNILTFRDDSTGKFLRSFDDIEAHDEHIIKRHNLVVGSEDTVYMMGDLVWKTNAQTKEYLSRLNGKLVLVAGNHDHLKWLWQTGRFDDIHMWKYLPDEDIIVSHVPLIEEDLKRTGLNLHGHIHQKSKSAIISVGGKQAQVVDPRYMCLSMEQIEYTPIDLDTVRTMATNRFNNLNAMVANANQREQSNGPDTASEQ